MKHPEIITQTWQGYQSLVQGFGDNCWKVKSVGFSIYSAVISYAFVSDAVNLYLLLVPIIAALMFVEAGYRRLQVQYINKIRELEITLNDLVAGEEFPRMPNEGICSALDLPDLRSMRQVFGAKRFLFWGPYLLMGTVAGLLWLFNITKS